MNLNEFIFREYDIRGKVSDDFPEEVVVNLGKGFGTFIKRAGGMEIALSGDVRDSTPTLKDQFKTGVLSTGVDVIELGLLPTPLNYFSMYNLEVAGAVQVTGSHNPPEFNGFKMSRNKKSVFGKTIQDIKHIIQKQDFDIGIGTEAPYKKTISDYEDLILNKINIEVKSSFIKRPGTLVTKRTNLNNNRIITGISSTHNDAKVTLVGVKDRPGVAASIFKPLSINSINVDMVVQNISPNGKETDLTFTIKAEDLNKTKKIIQDNKSIKFKKVLFQKGVSKISIIGVGMITTPGVTFRMFQALANKKINIQVISTSEIKISVLINKKDAKKALVTLHKEFKLQD